jgi:hypothetical protein
MKASKLRNHPLPTHQQLVDEMEEKMERMEEGVPDHMQVDEEELEEETGDVEEVVREGTLKA